MKKYILTALFFATILNKEALGQKRTNCPYPQHEISGGYGGFSNSQLGLLYIEPLAMGAIDGLQDGNGGTTTLKPIGPMNLTYKYFFKYKGSIGASIVYSSNQITRTATGSNVSQSIDFQSVAFVPRIDFYYIREPKFAMYGYAAGGVEGQFVNGGGINKKSIAPAYQFSLLSFRFGRTVGFVLELGFGNLGVVNGGVGYRHYNRPWTM